MTANPDGIIAGRSLDNGHVTWSHKYDMNVVFAAPDDAALCSNCGGPLIVRDGKWHPVRLKGGKYYCENCSVNLSSP
jgi:predicted RNA-binding Zn-ribbon protein involved in translation (DUF1610 family)